MKEKKTASEIIDFVVNHFENNPRAKDEKSCVYINKEGHRCAHSICLDDSKIDVSTIDGNSDFTQFLPVNSSDLISRLGDKIHKEEFQGHSSIFWGDIQILHDGNSFWEDGTDGKVNQLTEKGKARVQRMKEKFA